ncbi:MAG: GWxTD domain-containing protein [Calditrichaeota bacterium]|nr:GWxTD domain-containing protein [Calditrichota bacterium]RQW02419.1 MAG: GWxTD domain-containing protein [Calditrichota bacterium]
MLRFKYFLSLLLFLNSAVSVFAAEWTNYETAVQFFQRAEFDSTIRYASRIDKSDSLYFYSRLLVGHALLEMDELSEAKELFESLLEFRLNRSYVYNGLGLYHLYKYQDSKFITKFLKRIFSTDDLEKAVTLFERAIRLDPDYLDARLNKNRALIISAHSDSLINAITDLELLSTAYPDNLEIKYYLGEAKLAIGNVQEATYIFFDIIDKNPNYSGAQLSLAFIFFDQKEYNHFSEHYMKALPGLYNPRRIKDLYQDILDIMNSEEIRTADSRRLTGQFFVEFWEKRDPLRITPANERLIEHYKRLEYARANYPGSNQTGYDDRGHIYVKYGPPDDYYRFNTVDGFVLENESWVYNIAGETYNFDFVNNQSGYILTTDLSRALVNPDYRLSFSKLQDLYNRRAHLSNYYATVSRELASVDPRGTPDYLMEVSGVLNLSSTREKVKKENLPVSVYELEMEGTDLPFEFDVFKYYEPDSARWFADFIYVLKLENLNMRFRDQYYKGKFQEKLIVWSTKQAAKNYTFENTVEIISEKNKSSDYFAGKLRSPLFFGENQMHFQLEDRNSDRFRIIQNEITAVYPENRLVMSDILLSTEIRPAQPSDNQLFSRNNFYIHPVPGRNFLKEKPLFSYFEIYYIAQAENGTKRCLIETKIKNYRTGRNLSSLLDIINPFSDGKTSKSAVSIINEMEFSESFEPVVLAFDVSQLEAGIYEFIIRVTDQRSGQSVDTKKLLYLSY